ncbi:DUF817 domain-containing protein [Gymnodinialimonas ceratoperidinii]|uniref:DUF817 domain-containing protein n=1 Tax=Gymnodinialimonas ceratoperidinii TaxID=2856823 RepID=A0A8F6YAP2_9RHOB|nr:DUF817 domain-containing protein [Gymnodinialimonas ceratoperidinii]QXT39231.1 DUF817 domain-containing protein [Gymnodinialimonas ceratoperidinii]
MAGGGVAKLERLTAGWPLAAVFLAKLLFAALFGVMILSALIVTRLVWQDDWAVARYDALVIFALVTQIVFIWRGLETWEEARVILIFHVTGTLMEIFKLAQGSWDYPDQGLLEIGGVPLFSGFMYASVGSFIARAIRLFHIRFAPYPPFWATYLLAVAIYVNFYTHHYTYDIRWLLFAATLLLFWRTRIWLYIRERPLSLRLPLGAFLSAWLLWIAENVGTFTQTWSYAVQGDTGLVDLGKFGSWYLLIFVAFVTVTLVVRDAMHPRGIRPPARETA